RSASVSEVPIDLKDDFSAASANAQSQSKPSKAASSITFRVSAQERSRLEADARGLSLSAYVRRRLFGADIPRT
ncbi:MAG: hypothetical protein AAGH41_14765, partial [Pseudomonadota bacterium]